MSAHIGFMDALIGAVRTAHSHRQESEEGNEAGHASLSQSLSPTHAQASAREHASASEDIGPKRSSHSDLISVNEHAEKCNQVCSYFFFSLILFIHCILEHCVRETSQSSVLNSLFGLSGNVIFILSCHGIVSSPHCAQRNHRRSFPMTYHAYSRPIFPHH